MFKARDYRISPFELESALIEHEAVAEAAVVPSPDPLRLRGAEGVRRSWPAAASPTRELALEIFRHMPRHAARRTSASAGIEFADLPKTISGKIRRVELRAVEERRRAKASGARTSSSKMSADHTGHVDPRVAELRDTGDYDSLAQADSRRTRVSRCLQGAVLMKLNDWLLSEFDREVVRSRKALEQMPDGKRNGNHMTSRCSLVTCVRWWRLFLHGLR